MNRRPSTQDITWLLDLNNNNQLDLDPPYQRRSVWTTKDRRFFLDTIFRNYPSPSIFLHKTINDLGKSTYHVVDGKQRLETILNFVDDKIKLANDYGDAQLDGKKWSELADSSLKQRFWNYQITVDQLDFDTSDTTVVNQVFDRLNRNSNKLTPQELRHAKYDGWFITEAESETLLDDWITLGVVTKARTKRMVDCQFISELMLVVLEKKLFGFDQRLLDQLYAKYDDPDESVPEFDESKFHEDFNKIKNTLIQIEECGGSITKHAKGVGNFYTLWGAIALSNNLPPPTELSLKYADFMTKVEALASPDYPASHNDDPQYMGPAAYFNYSRGASTDLGPRISRYDALRRALGLN
jgi:hypothetical protein